MINLSLNNIANYGLTLFQDKILESVKETSLRIVAVALMALTCITALYLAYQCCCASDDDFSAYPDFGADPFLPPMPAPALAPHSVPPVPYFVPPYTAPFSIEAPQFKNAILAIRPQKKGEDSPHNLSTPEEEKKRVKAIKENWLDDPQQELTRILDAKLFPDSIQKAISQPATPQISQVFSVMGRALEIKNLYRHSHYVFTHGQAPEISFANLLMKQCIRLFTPGLFQSLKPHSAFLIL